MRIRIRRFGERGSDMDYELRQAVDLKPAFGEEPVEQRGVAEVPGSIRGAGQFGRFLRRGAAAHQLRVSHLAAFPLLPD